MCFSKAILLYMAGRFLTALPVELLWDSLLPAALLALAAAALRFTALYHCRTLNLRLCRAAWYEAVADICLTVMLVLAVWAENTSSTPLKGLVLISLAGIIIFSPLQLFQLFFGLDGLSKERGFPFPEKRMRWGFWLFIIQIAVGMFFPDSVPKAFLKSASQLAVFWLLYTYRKAVVVGGDCIIPKAGP